MIRSTNQELGEYDLIRDPKHVVNVWAAVERALPAYWARFVEGQREADPVAQLAAKFGKPRPPKTKPEGVVLAGIFEAAVASYEAEAQKYRRFFTAEAFEEYRDDPNAFKQALARDVPVIANTLRQKRVELKDWQIAFRSARANDLLELFSNVLDFSAEWAAEHSATGYAGLANAPEPAAFGLDPLDDDDSMSLVGVVGMGIKSQVLYHLDPERFPARGQDALYALYFLSGRGDFGLPSKSSEFLMVNDINPASDGSLVMDQNYYYPYGLFSLYVLRLFNWIEQRATAAGVALDHSCRYVYVARFFEAVRKHHSEDLKTMRAHERFEVPF